MESVKGQKYLYLFVSRKNEQLLCTQFQKDAEKMLRLKISGTITQFRDLFEQLMIFATQEHFTLIIDEFQEFDHVNPSIFSEIQNLWDQYKGKAKINFIACGSIYSLMMKIFENRKEPLFGRLTSKIILQPFAVSIIKEILGDYNPKYTSERLTLPVSAGRRGSLFMDAGAITAKQMLDMITRC